MTEPVPYMACTMVYGDFANIKGAYLSFAEWLQKNSEYKMADPMRLNGDVITRFSFTTLYFTFCKFNLPQFFSFGLYCIFYLYALFVKLGTCHQQAFWQEYRKRIPAKIRNLTEDCIACHFVVTRKKFSYHEQH